MRCRTCLAGLVIGVLLTLGLAEAKPPHWAPAHGYRAKHGADKSARHSHHYYYYPQSQVYFCPERRQYFWMDAGAWKVGVQLPPTIRVTGERVAIDLDTAVPYTRHPEIIVRFPLGR